MSKNFGIIVAKRIKKSVNNKKRNISDVLIMLGVLFTIILFFIKITIGSVGWLGVFAPTITAFFIVFILSALKMVIRKI